MQTLEHELECVERRLTMERANRAELEAKVNQKEKFAYDLTKMQVKVIALYEDAEDLRTQLNF